MTRLSSAIVSVILLLPGELLAQGSTAATARAAAAGCDGAALQAAESEFLRLVEQRRAAPPAVVDERLREASLEYVIRANACYDALYGGSPGYIDDGGLLWGTAGAESYNLGGRKWGAGSPFTPGPSGEGPRIPGGIVTYSFMGSGISFGGEGYDGSVALSAIPTYAPCFLSEITNAFAAWSAVANIRFAQVADSGTRLEPQGTSE